MALQKIELDLVENGKDSLRHAVEHFTDDSRPTDLKYAVLHVFHAVELFLKAVLGNAHPTLIFQKPEESNKPSARTVDFGTLLDRLKAVGVELEDDELETLQAIRSERNKIEHYKVAFDKKQVKVWIGRAMRFLDKFVDDELDFKLEDVLDLETYRTLAEAVYSYKEQLEKARKSLPGQLPDDYFAHQHVSCPDCLQDVIPFPDPDFKDNKARCRFCDAEFYATDCRSCGGAILKNDPFTRDDDPVRCSGCWSQVFAHAD